MFRAYIDESSESGNAVFAVGGFAGRQEEWLALEPLWLDALPKGIDYFHATDCVETSTSGKLFECRITMARSLLKSLGAQMSEKRWASKEFVLT